MQRVVDLAVQALRVDRVAHASILVGEGRLGGEVQSPTIHARLVVAVARDAEPLHDARQVGEVVGRQRHGRRRRVLVDALAAARAGDRHDERMLGQQPREGDLRGRGASLHAARARTWSTSAWLAARFSGSKRGHARRISPSPKVESASRCR